MGFFSNIVGATVKVALTPIAVAKDVVNVISGDQADSTKDLIKSAGDDVEKATEELADGELI